MLIIITNVNLKNKKFFRRPDGESDDGRRKRRSAVITREHIFETQWVKSPLGGIIINIILSQLNGTSRIQM